MYFYVNMAFWSYQHSGGRKTISIISGNTEAELLNPIRCLSYYCTRSHISLLLHQIIPFRLQLLGHLGLSQHLTQVDVDGAGNGRDGSVGGHILKRVL